MVLADGLDYWLIIRSSPAREARDARPSTRARADVGDGEARGTGWGVAVARGLTFECRLCAVLMCGSTAIRQPRRPPLVRHLIGQRHPRWIEWKTSKHPVSTRGPSRFRLLAGSFAGSAFPVTID